MPIHYQKIIALILIVSFSAVLVPKPVSAGSWGESIQAALLKQTLEELYTQIKETMVANLKMMAIRIIQGRLQTLLTGSPGKYGFGGGAMFITNWRQQIFGSAEKSADVVVNNYFQSVTSGTGQIGQRITGIGEKAFSKDITDLKPTLDSYTTDVSKIFKGGSTNPWRAWLETTRLENQPFIYAYAGEGLYGTEYGKKSSEEALKGVAYKGYKPATAASSESGKYGPERYGSEGEGTETITTPGSLIADITAEIQNMPAKMLALARSIPEIVSGMVTQMLTQMINQGLAKVTAPIDQQINNFRNQVNGSLNQAQNAVQSGLKKMPGTK